MEARVEMVATMEMGVNLANLAGVAECAVLVVTVAALTADTASVVEVSVGVMKLGRKLYF